MFATSKTFSGIVSSYASREWPQYDWSLLPGREFWNWMQKSFGSMAVLHVSWTKNASFEKTSSPNTSRWKTWQWAASSYRGKHDVPSWHVPDTLIGDEYLYIDRKSRAIILLPSELQTSTSPHKSDTVIEMGFLMNFPRLASGTVCFRDDQSHPSSPQRFRCRWPRFWISMLEVILQWTKQALKRQRRPLSRQIPTVPDHTIKIHLLGSFGQSLATVILPHRRNQNQ